MVSVLPPLTTRPRRRFEHRRAREGQRVHPGVPVEAPVLEAGDRRRELVRHRVGDAEAPLAVRRDRGPEQLAVAVEDHRRERVVERHDRHQRPEGEEQRSRRAASVSRATRRAPAASASGPASCYWPGATTSTHWPFARALRVASYIASTVTIGR